ncbi:hypothetical protein N7447_001763 [Penicillium robsamsonii]|uniref:uncharacterized protein n=1 Tax=Penicillium robsamsonii TaxID=1792511 RepID=UPI00254849C3|nr:uncharacterized protein N7447_001763 [Penicillium robsamsonii]KAJ5835737.1 hypothetical protein N7447_001763 [Penicillium robsamsonii]
MSCDTDAKKRPNMHILQHPSLSQDPYICKAQRTHSLTPYAMVSVTGHRYRRPTPDRTRNT